MHKPDTIIPAVPGHCLCEPKWEKGDVWTVEGLMLSSIIAWAMTWEAEHDGAENGFLRLVPITAGGEAGAFSGGATGSSWWFIKTPEGHFVRPDGTQYDTRGELIGHFQRLAESRRKEAEEDKAANLKVV